MPEVHLSLGRRHGVRAGRKILAGETIERAPVVVLGPEEARILSQTDLAHYLEPWPSPTADSALPLGFAPMYETSAEPNTRVTKLPDEMVMEIVAAVDIEEGEEVTVRRLWKMSGPCARHLDGGDGTVP